ncbi:hypothetical protein ACFOTA_09705 [Chitinophaga sp. GCM10012297]|uniref:Uncharacterized protein n=1 Tax=Chitinophaga chungangae TaxID=2821488 RepID=A0ABS3YCT9_9BACT|nr:hypothetical protein [Chitinophaga chungangae]MBO9152479.1 hypothetical protein [Chitinophaga chungangae]
MSPKGKDIVVELGQIAPEMGPLGHPPDFDLPPGYFAGFPGQLMSRIRELENAAEVNAELEELSPMLAAIPRKTPYNAPKGYFDGLAKGLVQNREAEPVVKILPLNKRIKLFKRCLVAAAVAGIVSVGAVFIAREYSGNALDRQLAKISDQEIVDFLQYHTDDFDNENIFTNVSLDEEMPSVLPEELTNEEIDKMLEENLLQEIPFNQ